MKQLGGYRAVSFSLSFLLFILFLTACERSPEDKNYMESSIETSQMMEDFAYFWKYIESEYPLYHVLQSSSDIEFNRNMYDNLIQDCRTNNGFARHMEEHISTLDNYRSFGQLHVLSMLQYDSLSTLYGDYNLWRAPLNDKEIKKHYMFTTEEMDPYNQYSVNAKKRSEISAKENFDYNVEIKVIEDGKVVVIRIGSFDYLYGGGMPDQINEIKMMYRQYFHELFSTYRDYANVIFDLTGNAEGYTEFWEDLIVRPNIRRELTWKTRFLYKNGVINDETLNKMMDAKVISMHDLSELPVLPELRSNDLEWFDSYITHECILEPEEGKAPMLQGKLWVLTDERTSLAADGFASFCKSTGFAELVGRQTAGGGISLPSYFALPNSRLVIRTDLGYGLNDDGSCNAVIGTIPDYISDDDEYPLDTCLRLISG